jgi:hypothetical protein
MQEWGAEIVNRRLLHYIISMGQLDEAGYNIHIKQGFMSIREPGGQLLARIARWRSMLYVLKWRYP